jgi:tritrans,polycis-undecaprenyl-diphosphate synthase [geranylgeranyl-diphosphate specific]
LLTGFLRSIGIYRLYEKWLNRQVRSDRLPEHIAVILDGNRRWAAGQAAPTILGHQKGAKRGEEFLDWTLDLNIKTVTLYVFSTENLQRNPQEVQQILGLIEQELKNLEESPRIHQSQVRVKALARLELLPQSMREILERIEKATSEYHDHYLNIAIAYGGRAEIIDATRKIAQDIEGGKLVSSQIDEGLFRNYLYTAHLPNPYPDLIVRTSGEERLSGFLLWQSAYSELCFLDVYWPDFRKIDLLRAIRTYQQRIRRFGT